MRRIYNYIYEKLHDESESLRVRLTRMALLIVAFIIVVMTIMSITTGQSLVIVAVNIIVEICIFVALYLSVQKRNTRVATIILFLSVDLLSLPVIFFTGGGVKSAAPEWYLLVLVMSYILLEARDALKLFIVGSISFIACVVVSYYNPQLVDEFSTTEEMIIDIVFSCGMIAACLGGTISILVNEFRKEQGKIEEKNKLIEQAVKSKDVFFANMSHEIRTPINTIIGLNEMILREKSSKETFENALSIQNASRTLLSLVNDVLDLSKLEAGSMDIIPNKYEVGAMISSLVNSNWINAQNKGLGLKVDIAKDVPSVLMGDETRIKQVISNLISNSIKYTQEGEIVLSARSEKVDDDHINLRLSVSDTGIGIKKDALDVLFDSLTHVDEENNGIEGYGLGLSICKKIVDLMGGKISVDSIYTKGSTFTVSIPQQVISDRPIGDREFTIKKVPDEYSEYRQSFEASSARVLIVDDNEMNLAVAAKLLSSTKVITDKAHSGEEALTFTETYHYDVILMDHLMPDMDGVETLNAIRKQIGGQCMDTPVIALTANVGDNANEIYKSYGFQGYLAKPISADLLEEMVYKFIPNELIEYTVSMDADNSDELLDEVRSSIGAKKKGLIISADCTSDIPSEYMDMCGIRRMYYNVFIGEKKFKDTLEITSSNLNELMDKGIEAISLPADVEEYEEFFGRLLTEADQVIHFTIGKRAGIAYSVASDAAKCFGNVHVVDSGTLTGGMGLLAMQVSEEYKAGKDVNYILEHFEDYRHKLSTTFMLQTTDNMFKTRKINLATYAVCKALHIKPILSMKASAISVNGFCIGSKERSVKSYIRRTFKKADGINTRVLVINYVGLSVKERELIKKEVARYVHFENVIEEPASTSIALYCGKDVFSFSFFTK